jgi:hypothetical protein
MRDELSRGAERGTGLVDLLDRVLDKGLVIAGDIKVSLAEVELLTIRIRLIVCSLDKAREIGLDWWQHDRYFSPGKGHQDQVELREQIRLLERKVAALTSSRKPRTLFPRIKRSQTPKRRGGNHAR